LGRSVEARALLANRPALAAPPSDVERWLETLLAHARAAAADRQHDTAFRIASRVDDAFAPGADVSAASLGVRDEYTSLTWLAGRTALDQLGRPREAAEMFARYGRAARSPQTITKGFYWAGRALRASDRAAADRYFDAAAVHHDHFYGMLALEALGRPLPAVARAPLPPAAEAGGAVQLAAEAAGRYGSWKDQTTFLRAIANDAKSEAEHRAAMALSARLGRPDLAVMAGRNARVNGHAALIGNGFPTVSVPAGLNDNWTIIHAIARQESQFDREATSHAGARGLMQLMPGTARETAGKVNLSYNLGALTSDPSYNITLGSTYIDRMLSYYGGSHVLAVAAYNAGPGNVNKWIAANGDPRTGIDIVRWIEDIPIYETRNYVQRVLENAVMYDRLHPDRARYAGATPLSTWLGKRTPG
jgi:soluble lytic murein transglycosylase